MKRGEGVLWDPVALSPPVQEVAEMVYESTTRRVYSGSSPRPGFSTTYSYSTPSRHYVAVDTPGRDRNESSYSRTFSSSTSSSSSNSDGGPGGRRVIPRIGHQRLCIVSPPPHRMNFQQIYNDLEEDQNEMVLVPMRRSQLSARKLIYLDDYFNSTNDEIEAETRGIKRDADSLLLRLACGYKPPMYSLRSIPIRNALEFKDTVDVRRHYVHERNMVDPLKRVQNEILRMSMYKEPMRKAAYIGRGHLACLSYAGGRPISKRRRFYPEDDKIRDDVNFRSYYTALRAAANIGKEYKKPLYQPIYRSKRSILGITADKKEDKKEVESKWESRCMIPKESHRPDPVKSVTLPTPRKSVVEMPPAPTPEPPQECLVTLPKPKQSVSEEPAAEPELPVENVVVKVPRKSVSAEPPAIPPPAQIPEKEKTPEVESAPEEPQQAPAEPEPQAPVEETEPEPPTEPEPQPEPEPAVAEEVAEPPASQPEPEPTPAEPVAEAEVSAPEPEPEPEPTAEEVPPEPAPEQVPQPEAPAQEPAQDEAQAEEPAAVEAPAPEEPTTAEEAEKGEDEETDVPVQVDEDEEMSVGEESDREIATPVAEPESEELPVEEPKEEESREDVSVAEDEVFSAAEPEVPPTPESPSEE